MVITANVSIAALSVLARVNGEKMKPKACPKV